MSCGTEEKLAMEYVNSAPPASSEHLCYVRCNFCTTVLAVVIPCKRLLDTVTVKCGHCSNVSFLTIRSPAPPQQQQQPQLPPPPHPSSTHVDPQLSLQVSPSIDKFGFELMEKQGGAYFNINEHHHYKKGGQSTSSSSSNYSAAAEPMSPKAPFVVKPPEKKHRLPSAYNRFMKEEIQRIKAANPEIPHREAFSAAAKNWARHVPTPGGGGGSIAESSSKTCYGMK